jgi:hypothetical protein
MNRACHLHTTGFDLPDRRIISAVPQPSAVARMMLARHTCFTGGGHNAFSRYERGEAAPLPAVINLFRLLDKHPELLKDLV